MLKTSFFILVVVFFTSLAKCEDEQQEAAIEALLRAPTDIYRQQIANSMWIHVYERPRKYSRISYSDGVKAVLALPQYQKNKKTTVIYFPGWIENPQNKESVNYVTDALMMRNDVNVLVWDYSQNVQGDDDLQYLRSYINCSQIGSLIGKWLLDLKSQLPDLETKVRLVGHSMGAQITSFSANTYGKGKLRITALDPAYPLYIGPFAHLTNADGKFVDVIHTDSAKYGYAESIGHADFFPNNGVREQPYCTTSTNTDSGDYCSHHMSWRYWAESAKPFQEMLFQSTPCYMRTPCNALLLPSLCRCQTSGGIKDAALITVYMGYAADSSVTGDFYLETTDTAPFGKNMGPPLPSSS